MAISTSKVSKMHKKITDDIHKVSKIILECKKYSYLHYIILYHILYYYCCCCYKGGESFY